MKVVQKEAKTVDEAIKLAIDELGVSEEDVKIDIIEKGSKGIFGLIGVKNASVKVTYEINYEKVVKDFMRSLLNKMNIDCDIDVKLNDSILNVNLSGQKIGLLIGSRGETLDAIQYLTSLIVNKSFENGKNIKVFVDAENYREKRQKTLTELAKKLANTVRKTGKRIELEPMNAYERRIIHCSLEGEKFIETYSLGDEPNRRVVITLKSLKEKKQKAN